jgi:protein TonB
MPFNKAEALRRAEEHVARGEITGAIAIHRMIAQADPYDLNTINALGELYVRAGRTKEAIEDFTRIADGYLNNGSGIKAAYLLRKALDLDPTNASALMKLGEIYLREGMIEKAHDEFIRAGALLLSEGQITGALQANHRALTAKPGSPQARAAIAALQAEAAVSQTGSLPKQLNNESADVNSSGPESIPAKPPSGQMENLSTADKESLIQQLSKAEMLVGYGEVERGIALLKEVVNRSPDNLDVHGKLKDIYLRNEMIREAGLECLELARIHESRGESARASEYTMRAGRLALSSGQLGAEPVVKAPSSAASYEPRGVAVSAIARSSESEVPESKVQREPLAVQQPSAIDLTSDPSETVRSSEIVADAHQPPVIPVASTNSAAAEPIRREPDAQLAGVSTVVAQPPRQPVYYHKPVAERTSGNLELRVKEVPLVTTALSEHDPATPNPLPSHNGLVVQSPVPLTYAAVAPVSARRAKRLYIAAMAMMGVVALTLGAIKGASMYGAQLDRQYAELTVASSAPDKPAAPGLPSVEDLNATSELEAVKIEPPPAQIVTPSGRATEQEFAANQPSRSEPEKASPSVPSEPSRVDKSVASPPMVAVTDQRGGENNVPRGLLTGAPQTVAPAPSPPPSAPAPRASVLIKGQALKQVQPDYPAIARGARQEGAVPVEVSINENGDVVSARAVAGPILLRTAAESAARQWKFKPSTRDGKPLATATTITFRFKL